MMVETFQALAEPNRLRIFELLGGGPLPVGEIADALALRQPQVSKHLAVLKAARLVNVEARANQRVYELQAGRLAALSTWVERYRRSCEEQFTQLDGVLDQMKRNERMKARKKHGRRKQRN